jgi:hypothetical protein
MSHEHHGLVHYHSRSIDRMMIDDDEMGRVHVDRFGGKNRLVNLAGRNSNRLLDMAGRIIIDVWFSRS